MTPDASSQSHDILTICYVITGLDYAGAEIQLVEVIRRLRRRGHRIFVVSLMTPLAFVRELGELGVSVLTLDLDVKDPPTPGFLARFVREVGAIRPDVIHGHLVHANLLSRVAAWWWRIPVAIATVHSTDEGGRSRLWLYRLTERMGTVTTSVSEAGRQIHLQHRASRADRLLLTPNGIDADRFRRDERARQRVRTALGVPRNRFVWLSVTRFHPPKDPPTLLRAFAQVPTDSELWLVGQGRERPDAERLVEALGLGDRVRFLGVRTDIPDLLSACDGFALSSKSEAMPIALLEAAAAEAPCVASDVGEIRVMLGPTGFVVPPLDPGALGQALEQVEAMTPSDRGELGASARARVLERWSLEAVVDRWEALYSEHLAR